MKFKVGDKVKVKGSSRSPGSIYAVKEGVVKKVTRFVPYPYKVEFEKLPPCFFHAIELEKVE